MFNKTPEPSSPSPTTGGPPLGAALPGAPPSPQPPMAAPTPSPAPSTRPADADKPSVLGPDLRIRGGIEGRGEIQLQGRAWGDVRVERLIVTETAELEGSVVAITVEVRGRVVGGIEASNVRLLPSARVEGDITYEQLQIDIGAQFEGRCIRARKEAAAPAKADAEKPPAPKPPPVAKPADAAASA